MQTLEAVSKVKEHILSLYDGLVFSPLFHTYHFAQRDLANVSSFSSRLGTPFNEDAVKYVAAAKAAKGHPASEEYYKKRWEYLRDEAGNRGSRVHLFAEQYPTLDIPVDSLEQGVCNFYKWIEQIGYEVVVMELRMTDGKLAGTCDLLLRHKITGRFVIADWKTNDKDITEIKYYHKPLVVFTNVIGNDLGKFTVQLNMYKYLLENKGIEVDSLWVIHLSQVYDELFEIYDLQILDIATELQEGKELNSMLTTFRKELADKKIAREARFKEKFKV